MAEPPEMVVSLFLFSTDLCFGTGAKQGPWGGEKHILESEWLDLNLSFTIVMEEDCSICIQETVSHMYLSLFLFVYFLKYNLCIIKVTTEKVQSSSSQCCEIISII